MYNNFSSKKTKKVISALLASALVVTSAPITANAATKKVVGVGKTVTYKAGATVKKITVKNKKVVKATKSKKNKKNVVLKGLKAGKTTVTIKTSKKTIKLNVCVGATKITKKTLKTTMTAGGKQTVSVTAAGGKGDTITFTSSKKSVLKVNKASAKASKKGIAKMSVAAVAEGTAKLTVASKNTGVKKAFTIKVVAATPAPATQPPTVATTPAVTGTATAVATTPAVQATATAAVPGATDATATPGTDVTATPGTDVTATPGADVTATPGTDVTQNPDATVAPTFDPVTAKEGTLTVTTNVSGASIKVISGDAVVASSNMGALENTTTTTTLAPGVYTVEISKKGFDTYKTTVTVNGNVSINADLTEEVVLGASGVVTNQIIGYDNVVLVNDGAIVTITVKDKDGNLVPNKTVVFSISADQVTASGNKYEVKGQNVQVTDANGKASFVVANEKSNIQATDGREVGSITYTARVLDVTDGTNAVATGSVGFASLQLGAVDVDEDMAKRVSSNLVPGENAKEAGYENTASAAGGVQKTYSLNNESVNPDVDYINTQQVSATGTKDREVSFGVAPKIVLPAMKVASDKVTDFVRPVNYQSGEYGTYVTDEFDKVITLGEDASKLQYATLIFNSIQLSEYTELTITSYTDESCDDKYEISGSKKTLDGELTQKNFGYQIPLTEVSGDVVKAVKVSIKSAGQVETDMNAGYDIKEIRGVYKAANGKSDGGAEAISTATVEWEAVAPTMSEIQPLDAADAVDLGITPADKKNNDSDAVKKATQSEFKYQVPVFPYTGNAVIKEYDTNHKVVAYYLIPTVKSTTTGSKNTNVINTTKKAYKATEQEATTYLTTGVTTNGNVVTVNSEEVGSTTLKGTIKLAGVGSDVLDASNSTVYTSVQWNPIPKAQDDASSSAFLALSGQKITVKAQLTDKNGNPVSLSNKAIDYTYTGLSTPINSNSNDKYVGNSIAIVKNEKTDVNGQATLVLSAADKNSLTGLAAACGTEYDVKLIVGGQDTMTDTADLYWVNADLSFQKAVGGEIEKTDNSTEDIFVSEPTVATPWQYAVKTIGNNLVDGILKDYSVTVDGLKIQTSFDTENKGTYEVVGNGVVNASSDFNKNDIIVNKLTSSSVGANVTFKATKGTTTLDFICVGEGTPNLNARMNLNVNWKTDGKALTMINPDGTNIADGTTKVYVKLTDGTGKNPLKDTRVTFKSSNANDIFVENDTTVPANADPNVANDGIAYTNEDGVVVVELTKAANVKSSVITATVENVDQVASKTINWVNTEPDFGVVGAAKVEGTDNQVELTFNNEVLASSVRADLFDVTALVDTKTVHYDVKSAKASGKSVILTMADSLSANEYTVSMDSITKDSVKYALKDETGADLTADSDVIFYSTKNATYNVNVNPTGTAGTNANLVVLSQIKAPITLNGATTEFGKYFSVVVDGEIVPFTQETAASGVPSNVDIAAGKKVGYDNTASAERYIFSIPFSAEDQSVSVYFMGEKITKTVAANATKATAAAALVDFNKTVAKVDKKLKAQTSGDIDLSVAGLAESGNTITVSNLGGTGASAASLDGSTGVELDTTDGTNYVAGNTVTFDVQITDTTSTVKKAYTLTIKADKTYEITCVVDDELDADVKTVKTTLTTDSVIDGTIEAASLLTNQTGSTTIKAFTVEEDLMSILTPNGSTDIGVTPSANATATFSVTFENAYEVGTDADKHATVTKTYKVVCDAAGSTYTVTEVE